MIAQIVPDAPPDSSTEQALFREARQRRRRRRWLAGIVAGLVTSAALSVAAVTWLPATSGQRDGGSRPSAAAQAGHSAVAVWWDDVGRLHVGDIGPGARGSQRVVAEVNAAWLPLAAAGRRVYWVDPAGAYMPALGHWSQVVWYFDVRTGQIGVAGPGQTVFVSADGRYLFMSQDPSSLTETPVAGGAPRLLTLPPGWYLPGSNGLADAIEGQGLATANGIVVQSRESPGVGARVIALWDPRTGQVKVIGRGRGVIDAYTPPGAPYSLLAWLPAACPPPGSCLIKITNSASLSTRTVRAPAGGLFTAGGAFAPGGSELAVFATSRVAANGPAGGHRPGDRNRPRGQQASDHAGRGLRLGQVAAGRPASHHRRWSRGLPGRFRDACRQAGRAVGPEWPADRNRPGHQLHRRDRRAAPLTSAADGTRSLAVSREKDHLTGLDLVRSIEESLERCGNRRGERPVLREGLSRDENETRVRVPGGAVHAVQRNEVLDIGRDERAPFRGRVCEELIIRERDQRGVSHYRDHVVITGPKPLGNAVREHLVKQNWRAHELPGKQIALTPPDAFRCILGGVRGVYFGVDFLGI